MKAICRIFIPNSFTAEEALDWVEQNFSKTEFTLKEGYFSFVISNKCNKNFQHISLPNGIIIVFT